MTPERAPPLHASKQDDHDGPLSPFEEGIAVWCWWTVCVCVPERDVIVHHGESITVNTDSGGNYYYYCGIDDCCTNRSTPLSG
jgi:hypothetical protein